MMNLGKVSHDKDALSCADSTYLDLPREQMLLGRTKSKLSTQRNHVAADSRISAMTGLQHALLLHRTHKLQEQLS